MLVLAPSVYISQHKTSSDANEVGLLATN